MTEEKYKKLYESTMQANVQLQRHLVEARARNETLEAEKRQWDAEKVKQQAIIALALNSSNATNNDVLEENKQLRTEIHRLKG